jgi:hypothetical protein
MKADDIYNAYIRDCKNFEFDAFSKEFIMCGITEALTNIIDRLILKHDFYVYSVFIGNVYFVFIFTHQGITCGICKNDEDLAICINKINKIEKDKIKLTLNNI